MLARQLNPWTKTDWIVISNDASIIERAEFISQQFTLRLVSFTDENHFASDYAFSLKPTFLICDLRDLETMDTMLAKLEVIRRATKKVPIFCLINEVFKSKDISLLSSQSPYLIFTDEFHSTSFEYFFLLKLKGESYPITIRDLFPSTIIEFNAYQLTLTTQKLLPVIFHHLPLSEKKFTRLQTSENPLYIRKEDALKYTGYIENFFGESPFGLKKRLKAKAYGFMGSFFDARASLLFEMSTPRYEDHRRSSADHLHIMAHYGAQVPEAFHLLWTEAQTEFFKHDLTWFSVAASAVFLKKLELPRGEGVSPRNFAQDSERLARLATLLALPGAETPAIQAKISKYIDSSDQTFYRGIDDAGLLTFESVGSFIYLFFRQFGRTLSQETITKEEFAEKLNVYWQHCFDQATDEDVKKALTDIKDIVSST